MGGHILYYEVHLCLSHFKKFVAADAVIKGNEIIVSHPMVKNPESVRYAWADNPNCNLYNKSGLPASPFRTDDWKEVTFGKQ